MDVLFEMLNQFGLVSIIAGGIGVIVVAAVAFYFLNRS